MCQLPKFPSLDEVIVAIEQEEICLKVLAVGDSTVSRSALAVPNNNIPLTDDRECYNCGQKGRLSWNYSSPRSGGRGRTNKGRGPQEGGRNWRGGRGRGGRGTAHLAAEKKVCRRFL